MYAWYFEKGLVMSKSVKKVVTLAAVIAMPYAAPAIAGSIGLSGGIATALGGSALAGTVGSAVGGAVTGSVLGGLTSKAMGGSYATGRDMGMLSGALYQNQNRDLFSQHDSERAIYLEYYGDKNNNKTPDVEEIGVQYLKGDGDFRSEESIALLKQADIVVTNPPFSLFREYVAQLIQYDKKFIILGNLNAITYKEIFPLIKKNKLWFGPSIHSGDREFGVPDNYPLKAAGYRIDKNGRKFIRVKGIRWFTNLDYNERHEDLILYKTYNPEDYPKYDNYDAINVDKTKEIPMDYQGAMGVPITFLDKYNPDQFEIIGIDRYVKDNPNFGRRFKIQGREIYARILIKN